MARRKRDQLAMDLTPLIDVVFLLLIFFLVTSVFKKEEVALLLQLPKTEEGQGSEDKKLEEITIELTDEEVAFNGKKTTLDDLPQSLEGSKPETLINLRVDGNVRYERLVKVLDYLSAKKLENISLITNKEKK
ncbi:MAG TPA: biopolymer transporter ExbD [Bacteriovoracaceae bacterium]|nr:biopolymer transporter ExbD [Bacteriovoracaceae bacterium]